MPNSRVLILGGTSEAVRLAERLHADPDIDPITSLAGRTRNPAQVPGEVRVGGFGGAGGLARYLVANRIDWVVDATHPYAAQISRNSVEACEEVGLPLLRLERPPWHRLDGDDWIEVPNTVDAARSLRGKARRVFLSIGRQDLAPFAECRDVWFLLRMIDQPDTPPELADFALVCGRGPFPVDHEVALLSENRIDTLVSKNSGGAATYGKIAAARRLSLPVIMISRPDPPPADHVATVEAVLKWLRRQGGARLR